jgi:magnesium chelatase subunit H
MAKNLEFVLLLGMERYSRDFFRKVEVEVRKEVPDFRLTVFEDSDTVRRPDEVEAAIARCSCLFMVVIVMSEHAEMIVPTVQKHQPPVVFGFESMPEIMSLTKVGNYVLHDSKGMPKSVQSLARMLVGGREEDAYYGYLKMQKIAKKVVNFLPGKRLADFRNWTNVNAYWNNRSVGNIANMFKLILREYLGYSKLELEPPVEIPTMGFAHPDAPQFFSKPVDYERWERSRKGARKKTSGTVAVIVFRVHLLSGMEYLYDIVRALEAGDLRVLPLFVMGVETHVVLREWLDRMGVDVVINTMGFPLVGGPAGSSKAGLTVDVARDLLSRLDVPYIVAQPLFLQDVENWHTHGVSPIHSTILYSLPEMDGAVAPVVLGGMQGESIVSLADRLNRLTELVRGFVHLRRKPVAEKKIAIVVYNYPPGMGNTATAALLDVPASLVKLLRRLRDAGYQVDNFPEDPAVLIKCLAGSIHQNPPADFPPNHPPIPPAVTLSREDYHRMVSAEEQNRINDRWNAFPGDIAPAGIDQVFLGGMQLGHVYVGVQPPIAMPGDPMRLLFDHENTPHHQYMLFYRWLVEDFGADAIVHMGMHGTAEWMPGLQLGVTEKCWPDKLLGKVPNFYVYPINNPAEANIAKRRGFSTIISHAIPPYGRAGLYKELVALKELLDEYRSNSRSPEVEAGILQKIELLNLEVDLVRQADEPFEQFASRVYAYLRELEQRLIVDSLHVLGDVPPSDQQLTLLTEVMKVSRDGMPSLADMVLAALHASEHATNGHYSYEVLLKAARHGDEEALLLRDKVETFCHSFVQQAVLENQHPVSIWQKLLDGSCPQEQQASLHALTEHGRTILAALSQNTQELDFLMKGLSGGYIPAVPGGDLIRDGLTVLPTGRNIHSLDPFRIPSDAAFARGSRIAEALLSNHVAEQEGVYPETIAQVLWGLDTIKTKGENIGTVVWLIGARPVKDGQGKIGRYELVPLAELGRPRIDVLMNASGIFRDNFGGTMDLLDRLIREAAEADEPEAQNFVRKHVQEMVRQGTSFEAATARIFTQSSGSYGTDVDEAIEGGSWDERKDLEDVFVRRNSYAYGGAKAGQAHTDVLKSLLGTVGHVSQEIDSVEYGLSDMQHYYGYSGALKAAAESHSGRSVKLSYVESFTSETKIQDLDQVLRMEYRTKLLNPKWYESMLRHGYNGAAEISNRFTYMLGWSATTGAVDNWVYDEVASTFVLDEDMRKRLESANPEAVRNAVGRLLEAHSRSFWQTDEETLDRLRELYADLEDRLEGVV